MYTALYRAFRPETFSSVVGQDHIVKILKNQIETETLSHSYLFCGTRGTGKTTTARLLAKAVNCLSDDDRPCGVCDNCRAIQNGTFADVIEIDAASNNGVENIRDLRDSVNYAPFMGRKKVYIIDEVHMLSGSAFNALLKTLEEPPESVMFILATTEPQKLPATILSRCLRLDFRRVPEKVLIDNMQRICDARHVRIEQSALAVIAMNADGSVRDSLSLLEQCLAINHEYITHDDVTEMLGIAGEEALIEMTSDIINRDVASAILLLDRVIASGKDVRQFMRDWLAHLRNLLIAKYIVEPQNALNMSCENVERVRAQSLTIEHPQLSYYITALAAALNDAKWSAQPRILLELCIVNMTMYQGESEKNRAARKPAPEAAPQRIEAAVSPSPSVRIDISNAVRTAEKVTKPKPVGQEKPQKAAARDASESMPDTPLDKEQIWASVINEGTARQGSFRLLRTGARIATFKRDECVIAADIGTFGYIEMNRKLIEELLQKHTGKKYVIKCVKADEMQNDETDSPENTETQDDLMALWSERLGVPVETE